MQLIESHGFPDNIYFISMSFLLTLLDLLEVSVLNILGAIVAALCLLTALSTLRTCLLTALIHLLRSSLSLPRLKIFKGKNRPPLTVAVSKCQP